MATQYTSILKLALPVTGELSGTWGDVVNNNITSMIEQAIAGLSTINTWTANAHTLTVADGTTSESRCAMLVAATGAGGTALTAAGEIICPAASKLYVLKNGAAYAVTLKTAAGTGVAVPAGDTAFLFCDGTNVNACVTTIVNGHISGNLTVDGNTTLGDANTDTVTVTAQFASDLLPSTDNARDLGSTAKSWRTLYCDTSVLVGNLSLAGNTLSSTDTNGNIVIAPNGTGDVQLDADTVRVGDSNANVTITTNGTGDLILNTNSGTNSGSITIEDGVNGNIIIAPNGTGQVQITNAALDLTTIEVTNIKAKDGTASITLADSTGVATLSANPILSGGTANGVTYLNASKSLTSGSALVFDGTVFSVNGGANGSRFAVKGTGAFGGFDTGAATDGRIEYAYNGTNIFYTGMDSASLMTLMARSSVSLAFGAGGSEKMRLTSAGTLNIVGAGTPGSTQAVSFNGSAPVDSLVLTSAGNVGIGTGSPAQKLDVYGNGMKVNNASYVGYIGADSVFGSSGVASSFTVRSDNALTFSTGGPYTRATIDSSGNLGLGVTPSAWGSVSRAMQFQNGVSIFSNTSGLGGLGNNVYSNPGTDDYYIATGFATRYYQYNGTHVWNTAASGTANNAISFTQAMTLDASGNLSVGTTGIASTGQTNGITSGSVVAVTDELYDHTTNRGVLQYKSNITSLRSYGATSGSGIITFRTGGGGNTTDTERARITSGGYFKASNTGTYVGSTGTYHELRSNANETSVIVQNTSATLTQSVNGIQINYSGASPNSTSASFLYCNDSTALRAEIRSDGGLANYSANNVNLASDERLKKDISSLASTWDKLKTIEVVNFRYKDCNEGDPLLYGVIAQQVQPIVPDLVVVTKNAQEAIEAKDAVLDADGNVVEPAVAAKEATPEYYGIREQPMYWLAIKALQEAMARIETLEAKIAVLESKGA